VLYHPMQQECKHMAPFANEVRLDESYTLCLHIITRWTALITFHPCAVVFQKKEMPICVEPHERRSVIVVNKGPEIHSWEDIFGNLLHYCTIPYSDVEDLEYHLEDEACDKAVPLPMVLENPGWNQALHIHIRVKDDRAFAKATKAEEELMKPVALALLEEQEGAPPGSFADADVRRAVDVLVTALKDNEGRSLVLLNH